MTTPIGENTRIEFRRRIEAAVENYHALQSAVVRIETRFGMIEKHLTEKLEDVSTSIKGITLVGSNIQELQLVQKEMFKKYNELEEQETSLEKDIEALTKRMDKYQTILQMLSVIVGFLSAIAVPVLVDWLKVLFKS